MPKKHTRKKRKVRVSVPASVAERIDKLGGGRSRADVLEEMVESALSRSHSSIKDRKNAERVLLAESLRLRKIAEEHEAEGRIVEASSAYLLSASRELEAASLLTPAVRREDEEALKSALLLVVQLIKKGSGYRHLPDVPSRSVLSVSQ